MGSTFLDKDRYIKNSRSEVINFRGEMGNPSIHPDSPKTITTLASITISSGKKSIRITNVGTIDCYLGDATVTSANGDPLFSNGESILFENVKENFIVYVNVASGSTELRIIEF